MNNLFCIIGRFVDIKDNKLFISVYNNYTKENETIIIELVGNMYSSLKERIKVKDIMGVKGHIRTGNALVAEKITFFRE